MGKPFPRQFTFGAHVGGRTDGAAANATHECHPAPVGSGPCLSSENRADMATKGCLSVTKYFLFIFNIIFFLLGSLLFGFGLWILFDGSSFAAALGTSIYGLKVWSYILSGVGIITMFIGFLGCLGSLKEIKCMLGFYFAILFLLFVTQITIGIIVYVQRDMLGTKVENYVKNLIKTYGESKTRGDGHDSWDYIQEQLHCCGWDSYIDWKLNEDVQANASSSLYPCSCSNTSTLGLNTTHLENGFCSFQNDLGLFMDGCSRSVKAWLADNIITIVGICLGVALLEVCLMSLSIFLCRNMDQNYDKLVRYS
ncbi:leukocyte antigen CD37 isoform B [Alligator mississippiensis]|uniref:Tetraspanin n=1 Tax=Alligator mississippiensis TaxID=8496 RepID=A0A151NK04_ALLMI|nr:leukocyte antigen CD37 isoform B [Alligator mississippiensis]